MTLIICPGIHNPALSDRFCQSLQKQLSLLKTGTPETEESQPSALLPTEHYAPFNGLAVWSYWQKVAPPQQPLLIVAFSAGVVGAAAAAQLWQGQGGAIAALIAVDGWGVPQLGEVPFYRVSHDYFTHWSSALLGPGQDSFYAEPPVDHLELWHSPGRTLGIWIPDLDAASITKRDVSAIEFMAQILLRHGCRHRLEFVSHSLL